MSHVLISGEAREECLAEIGSTNLALLDALGEHAIDLKCMENGRAAEPDEKYSYVLTFRKSRRGRLLIGVSKYHVVISEPSSNMFEHVLDICDPQVFEKMREIQDRHKIQCLPKSITHLLSSRPSE